jgi:hypothetical protein
MVKLLTGEERRELRALNSSHSQLKSHTNTSSVLTSILMVAGHIIRMMMMMMMKEESLV